MWYAIRRLLLGLILIGLASAVLLGSDWNRRKATENRRIPQVAILQYATRPLLDDVVTGGLQGLAAKGYEPGKTMQIKRFNAENDLPTANSMAKAILDGGFDLVFTVSTPCMQAMASVNREGKIIHVFAAVTDPFGAGVGISKKNPLDHPKWIAGVGTFQPVRDTFLLAKKLYPGLKSVGVTWNPAEACSEACVKLARTTCEELGVTLLEAQVDNSSGVLEASGSLVARGVQALYVGGDNTVELAIDSLVKSANQGQIPVFNNSPDIVDKGCLFGLGANYVEVGRIAGELAADILNGRSPATIPIEDLVPRKLALNLQVLASLRDPWKIPDDVRAEVDLLVDESGKRVETQAAKTPSEAPLAPVSKQWNIHYLDFVESAPMEESQEGFFEGFKQLGMVEGRDYTMHRSNAQGDMAVLTAMVDAALSAGAEMIVLTSTPTLQAVIRKQMTVPVLFTNVADPVGAGAGKSFDDHLPNVTGIGTRSDFEGMVTVVKECLPGAQRIGTLFCPAESNSAVYKNALEAAAKAGGLELVAVSSSTSAEVPDAALSLASKDISAICQISDNLHGAAFGAIVQAARKNRKPLFSFVSTHVTKEGAAVALARDFRIGGRDMAQKAVRVMRGERPGDIPFSLISRTVLLVNTQNAAQYGLTVPASILNRADVLDGQVRTPPAVSTSESPASNLKSQISNSQSPTPKLSKVWTIDYVNYVEADHVDETHQGFFDEFKALGMVEGRDYRMNVKNAQGDMATLTTIVDAELTARPDLILLTSTPTLQAVIQKVKDIPVIFSNVSNPIVAGAGTSNEEHLPNVTGISSQHDWAGMVKVIQEFVPRARRIGTLFCPSEVNSTYGKECFEKAVQDAGLELVSVASTSSAEVPTAALSMVAKGVDVICQIPDNLHDVSFASIVQVARQEKKPLFAFMSGLVRNKGGAVAWARDYRSAGQDVARLTIRVMNGEALAKIPFRPISKTVMVISLPNAAACGLEVPPSILARADEVIR